jgi:dTDP-4-amino-4,6-dideoxygalactose transaminase
LTQVYRDLIQEFTMDATIPFARHAGTSAAHLLPALLPSGTDRPAFMEAMKAQGIQTSIHYPPIHTFTAFSKGAKYSLPITEDIAAREVTLPLYPTMTDENVWMVVNAMAQALMPA